MGLFDRFSGSHEFADPSEPPRGAVGADGETYDSYGELLAGGTDTNPLLSGRNKYFIYNEMRRSDPAIKSLLWMFKLPIRSALWSAEPPGEGKDATDKRIAEAVERQFGLGDRPGRLDLSWDNSVSQALLMLDWGAMGEEKIWANETEEWVFDDGTTQTIRPLERLAPRSPSTIERIQDDTITGKITQVEQWIAGSLPIPGSKLLWYVLEKEGRNWWGTSLLRPCYGPWKLKKGLMIASAIGWDRFAAGVPVVRYPSNSGEEGKRQAEAIGRNYRTHERAWVTLEGPPIEKGGQWDLEILTAQMADAVPMLRHYDEQISQAGLQMFARLGTTETGSRAVGEVLGEPFYMAAQAIADDVADHRQKGALRDFVTVNFGADKDVPTLTVSKIGEQPIKDLAAALANLSSAGFYFKDPDTQNSIRDRMDLGHLPDDYVAMLEKTMGQLPEGVGLGYAGQPPAPGEPAPKPAAPKPEPKAFAEEEIAERVSILVEEKLHERLHREGEPAPAPAVHLHAGDTKTEVRMPDPPAPDTTNLNVALPPIEPKVEVHVEQPPAPPAPEVNVTVEAEKRRGGLRFTYNAAGDIERAEFDDEPLSDEPDDTKS